MNAQELDGAINKDCLTRERNQDFNFARLLDIFDVAHEELCDFFRLVREAHV